MSRRYVSAADRRRRRADRQGLAIILFVALALAGMIGGAIAADAAHGVSVSQSLRSAGL